MKRFVILLVFVMLAFSACTSELQKAEVQTKTEEIAEYQHNSLDEFYLIESNGDYTYNYTVRDKKGNVLISDKNISKEPKVEAVSENVISLSVQTGTGLATRWTVYCNIETAQKSDVYYYVLGQYENKVVQVELNDSKYYITVHDMFDEETVYSKTALEDVHTVEPLYDFEILNNGVARVTYLKGETYEKTEFSVDLK